MYILGTKRPNNTLAFGTTPFQHETLEDATREAQRLYAANRVQGQLLVFRAVRSIGVPDAPPAVTDLPEPDNEVLLRRQAAQQQADLEDVEADRMLQRLRRVPLAPLDDNF